MNVTSKRENVIQNLVDQVGHLATETKICKQVDLLERFGCRTFDVILQELIDFLEDRLIMIIDVVPTK